MRAPPPFTRMTDDLRFYILESNLPAGFLGTACAATALSFEGTTPGKVRLEYFYLLTRGEQRLILQSEEFPFDKMPDDSRQWDAARVHEEGQRMLERALEVLRDAHAIEVSKPELADVRVKLMPTEARPLMGAAMRGEWTDEIRTLAATVKTPALKRYCEAAANGIRADRRTN